MACYQRKGYAYVSGHYKKPQQLAGVIVNSDSLSLAPMPALPLPSQVPTHTELQESTPPQAKGMTGSGVMEAVVGSGVVAVGEYFAFYQPMLKQMKEMRQMLDVMGRKLNAIQHNYQTNPAMGMGVGQKQPLQFKPVPAKPAGGMPASPAPKPVPPLTPHQLNMKKLGLDPMPIGGKDEGMMLM